jgi:hypothetical protein
MLLNIDLLTFVEENGRRDDESQGKDDANNQAKYVSAAPSVVWLR